LKNLLIAASALSAFMAVAVHAAPLTDLPEQIGTCVFTHVKSVETRLQGAGGKPVPDSGSAISFVNGGYQVSYGQIPGVDSSQVGDKVMMCLASVPANCPAGDDRGKVYTTTNFRTGQSWTLPDSEHDCGGA
jgi:hypothetical protein